MATNANDTSFDLSNLTTTVEDIEIETKELDNELVAVQSDLDLKETELNKLTASNETLARKRAKIKAALWELKGPSKERKGLQLFCFASHTVNVLVVIPTNFSRVPFSDVLQLYL